MVGAWYNVCVHGFEDLTRGWEELGYMGGGGYGICWKELYG